MCRSCPWAMGLPYYVGYSSSSSTDAASRNNKVCQCSEGLRSQCYQSFFKMTLSITKSTSLHGKLEGALAGDF